MLLVGDQVSLGSLQMGKELLPANLRQPHCVRIYFLTDPKQKEDRERLCVILPLHLQKTQFPSLSDQQDVTLATTLCRSDFSSFGAHRLDNSSLPPND